MRKIFSIVLSIILLSASGGLFYSYRLSVFLHYQQVRQSIKSGRQSTPSILLLVPDNDLHLITWHKAGKEFEYRNVLYDLVSLTRMKGSTLFRVIPDKQEKRMASAYAHHKDRRKPIQPVAAKIFIFSCLLPDSDSSIIPEFHYIYPSLSHFPASCTTEIHSPPPKVSLFS